MFGPAWFVVSREEELPARGDFVRKKLEIANLDYSRSLEFRGHRAELGQSEVLGARIVDALVASRIL